METDGWMLVESVIDADLVFRLKEDLHRAEGACREIQVRNGIGSHTEGTVHHLLGMGDGFLEFLRRAFLHDSIREFFGGPYILNSFGGVINRKGRSAYVAGIHRDVRRFTTDLKLMLNMLVLLDDFTADNGATWFLPGSHRFSARPSQDEFFANAVRVTGAAGSVVLFDSRLWHAAGENRTDRFRSALTLTFTPPFIKPQYDYPRSLGYDFCEGLPEHLQQVLGYFSRVPETLDEWYQPPEKRFYRPGQD